MATASRYLGLEGEGTAKRQQLSSWWGSARMDESWQGALIHLVARGSHEALRPPLISIFSSLLYLANPPPLSLSSLITRRPTSTSYTADRIHYPFVCVYFGEIV